MSRAAWLVRRMLLLFSSCRNQAIKSTIFYVYSLLFPDLSCSSRSVFFPMLVLLISAFRLAGSPSCVLLTFWPSLFASVPRTFFECGNSPDGFEGVGAPTLESQSFPCPRGGAESSDGSFLSSFSGFRDVASPSDGTFESFFMASWVFGLSSVPRTVFECGLELMLGSLVQL